MKKKRGFKIILFGSIVFTFFKIFLSYDKNPPELFGDTIQIGRASCSARV